MRRGYRRPSVLTEEQRAALGPPEGYRPMVFWVLGRLPAYVKARMVKGDLEQAGWLGLMNAYRLYDPAKGVKFSTYAIHKIRWAMLIEAGLTNHGWPPPTVEYDDGRRHEL